MLRKSCFEFLNYDILGLSETHFTNDNKIELPGFKWYGRNRKNNHVNAKTGSGGVGFLVKEQFINDVHVEIKDNSHDDILW